MRCVSGSKARIDSSVSPKKSSRTGAGAPGAKRSRMPPRIAYSPMSRTVLAREKPLVSSQRASVVHVDAVAGRGGKSRGSRRSRAAARAATSALTVSTRMRGRSSAPRVRASRASTVMRCGGDRRVGRDAVVGLAIPGREDSSASISGAAKASASMNALRALAVARDEARARRRAPRPPWRARARDRRRRRRRSLRATEASVNAPPGARRLAVWPIRLRGDGLVHLEI